MIFFLAPALERGRGGCEADGEGVLAVESPAKTPSPSWASPTTPLPHFQWGRGLITVDIEIERIKT